MPSHLIFFLSALSFLSGVFFAALGLPLLYSLIPAVVLGALLYATNVDLRVAGVAALLLVLGSGFYIQDDYRYQAARAALPPSGTFMGLVSADPRLYSDMQSLVLTTSSGKIAIAALPSPVYSYGDALSARGNVQPPTPYQEGEHIIGQLRDPKIVVTSSGGGNPVLAFLFDLKNRTEATYTRSLSPDQAAFLIGIIFGDNGNFSQQFAKNLEVSGLRFITAIDGLHMQYVMLVFYFALVSLLPRRVALIATFGFGFCYIALTGFTASGIRAALMAAVAGFANESRRLYLPHNALALVALVLTLENPKTLLLDAGFQLSFLAVIGIIYLLPLVRALLHAKDAPGLLAWRESLLITFSVQLMTAPLVMLQFQTFSLISFVASSAIVWMLPLVIIGGFALALAGALSAPLAYLLHFILAPMMDYLIIVVNGFAKLAVLFNPQLGFVGVAAYYGVLIGLMYWYYAVLERAPAEAAPVASPPQVPPISAEAAGFTIIETE